MDLLDSASKFATVGGFIFTAMTFGVIYHRTRKNEQMRTAIEFSRNLVNSEDKYLHPTQDADNPEYEYQKRYRHMQYINEWEFFSFLVNSGEISDPKIQEYFKPTLIDDYEVFFSSYPEYANDNSKYAELKKLYQKWKKNK
jgi:hypothetical protein